MTVELQDALPIVGWAHQFPVGPANAMYETQWNSAVCNRLTISHRQGDVVRYRAEFLAYDRDSKATVLTTWPSTANHVPAAAHTYINWSDEKLTGTDGMHIKCPGGSNSYIRVVPQSWQITLDNALIAPFAIGEGRRPFQPVRNGKREVRFTATMAYDDAMVEVLGQIHGVNEAAAGKAFHAKMHYQCPGTTTGTADSPHTIWRCCKHNSSDSWSSRSHLMIGHIHVELLNVRNQKGKNYAFLDHIRAKFPSLVLAGLSSKSLASISHAKKIISLSLYAKRHGLMLSKKLETDILLRFAATTQISDAIKTLGIEQQNEFIIIAIGKKSSLDKLYSMLATNLTSINYASNIISISSIQERLKKTG